MELGIASVAAITIIAYIAGKAWKLSAFDDKWIPIVVGTVGGMLGVVGLFIMPDFPASDIINAIAVGIVSGLAATGINQAVRQLQNN